MAGPNIGVQLEGFLRIRCRVVQPSHVKLGLCPALPTLGIERVQVDGSAVQVKSIVKAAEILCSFSRRYYICRNSGLEIHRPFGGSICSWQIEVDKEFESEQFDIGRCQVWIQRQGSLERLPRKPLTAFTGNEALDGLPVARSRQADPRQRVGGIQLSRP